MEENKKVETEEITTEEFTENSDLDITEEISEKPKNNNKIKIIVGVICLLVLCVAGYFFLNQKKEKVYDITYPEALDFEYGSDLNSLITVSNADSLTIKVVDTDNAEVKEIKLNTEYKLEITVFDKDKSTTLYKEGIKFIDTTAPVIEVKTKEVEIPVNHVVIKAEATATDNYDKTVKVDIDTKEVDVTKVGTYKVYAIAKDTAGNESKVEIPVKVVEEKSLSETAKETVKKQIEQYIKENPDSEVAKQYNTETTTTVNKTTTSNTNNSNKQGNATVPSTGKSQQQIAAEEKAKQQEAQRRAEEQRQAELNAKKAECEAQWGKWNGSACTWDQPAEQPAPQPEQPQQPSQPTDGGNAGGRDDGCSVSAKLAEYEAYYNEWSAANGGAWAHSYEPESGQLRLYIHDGNGKSYPETRREYYCKQP
ncbi:MAG: DUF5011 domain-containing protein [Erysipelotrichaceae bacterium]|nr:DUF5011 domain-containing protein [Erysipelotrichaceae bacterium]